MKVSIGMNIQSGPWGGGNRFGQVLANHLRMLGHEVVFDLASKDIDLIVLMEPDRHLRISAYDHGEILRYLLFVNPRALVVHRVNNSSEARDDPEKQFNRFRILANRVADHTVFVSQWLLESYQAAGYDVGRPHGVILNGGDDAFWRPKPQATPRGRRLKLVTHHWSTGANKGFAVYQQLDAMLHDPVWSGLVEFTFIGRVPEGFEFQHTRHLAAMTGEPLVAALQEHDVYLTASLYEAGPNHILEGALCGLPLMYIKSGAMAEYCQGFGLEYTQETLGITLTRMIAEYDHWAGCMAAFPYTAKRMCQGYLELFAQLLARREEIMAARHFWRSPRWLARTLLHRDRRP